MLRLCSAFIHDLKGHAKKNKGVSMAEYAILLLVIATMAGIVGVGLSKHITTTANTSTGAVDTQTTTAKNASANLSVP